MGKEQKDITIKDVAKRAGVAISTVSRVLNGLDKVRPETRERVWEAVRELGYVQNSLAVSMVTGQTKSVMMVVPDFTNDFNGAVIQGAEEYLKEQGYTVLIFSTRGFSGGDFETLYRRFSKLADGMLAVPGSPDTMDYGKWKKPFVLIDGYRRDSDGYSVEIDNEEGAYLLTEELIRNGHRRIGLVGGMPGVSLGGRRIDGCRQALRDYGLPEESLLLVPGPHFEETGYRAMTSFLDMPEGLRPTGVVAINNLTCIGCMKALLERGMKPGREISLVGFDDHLPARYSDPAVTVLSRPTIAMGREGARLLVRLLRGETPKPRRVVMETKLLRRQSVKYLAGP